MGPRQNKTMNKLKSRVIVRGSTCTSFYLKNIIISCTKHYLIERNCKKYVYFDFVVVVCCFGRTKRYKFDFIIIIIIRVMPVWLYWLW